MGQIKNIKLHIVTDIKESILRKQHSRRCNCERCRPTSFRQSICCSSQEIQTQSSRICHHSQNIKSSRIRALRSRLVLCTSRIRGTSCIPSTQRWSGCCAQDIRWCKKKWHETISFLSQLFICSKKSAAVT